jgi:hypothetical protein
MGKQIVKIEKGGTALFDYIPFHTFNSNTSLLYWKASDLPVPLLPKKDSYWYILSMDKQENQTEFYSPFAHIPGKYEWCRIHSHSHGSLDTFIVIQSSTDQPVTVYVNSANGEAFMADRYPESCCIRVSKEDLQIHSSNGGRVISGLLNSDRGDIREAFMLFHTTQHVLPVESVYGGQNFRVWGSRWICSGIDLELEAWAEGRIRSKNGTVVLEGEKAVITCGSYGIINKLA